MIYQIIFIILTMIVISYEIRVSSWKKDWLNEQLIGIGQKPITDKHYIVTRILFTILLFPIACYKAISFYVRKISN